MTECFKAIKELRMVTGLRASDSVMVSGSIRGSHGEGTETTNIHEYWHRPGPEGLLRKECFEAIKELKLVSGL
ncbi:hypothetical protein FOZ62_029742, partial [Perkinsus olseni]